MTGEYDDTIEAALARIEAQLQSIKRFLITIRTEDRMSTAEARQAVTDLKADLERQRGATASVKLAVDTLLAKVEAAAGEDMTPELQELLAGYRANTDEIAAAAMKGTPGEGA